MIVSAISAIHPAASVRQPQAQVGAGADVSITNTIPADFAIDMDVPGITGIPVQLPMDPGALLNEQSVRSALQVGAAGKGASIKTFSVGSGGEVKPIGDALIDGFADAARNDVKAVNGMLDHLNGDTTNLQKLAEFQIAFTKRSLTISVTASLSNKMGHTLQELTKAQ